MADEDGRRGVEIPTEELRPEVLRGLVEEFVTRDGTDYGAVERSLEEKIEAALAQLRSGEARVVFDPESESANIVLARDLAKP
ncbi:MAG: YheU family protein [Proteobacteria bacterium]|nr:YheU family protein [Pseudomonadota bacterium]